jgi:hypothetical protein
MKEQNGKNCIKEAELLHQPPPPCLLAIIFLSCPDKMESYYIHHSTTSFRLPTIFPGDFSMLAFKDPPHCLYDCIQCHKNTPQFT